MQWPIKLPDLWPQLFALCKRRQEWRFIHGERSLLCLVFCELLFCTLLHSPWHWQVWGTQPEHCSAAGGGTALLRPWKSCFKAAKDPLVLQKSRISTNQVKPGGQKHACLRSIRQVPVYLNTDLEIYLQKDMVGTSPCSLSITAYAQLPQWWKWGWGGRCWWTPGQNLALRFAKYQTGTYPPLIHFLCKTMNIVYKGTVIAGNAV